MGRRRGVVRLGLMVVVLALAACAPLAQVRPSPGSSPSAAVAARYEAGPASASDDLSDLTHAAVPFAVRLPRGWPVEASAAAEPSTGAQVVSAVSRPDARDERAGIQIVWVPVPGGRQVNLPVEIAASEATLRRAGAGNVVVDVVGPVTVNGLRGEERRYTYTLNEQRVRQRTVFLASDRWFYTVAFVAPVARADAGDALFDAVLGSFTERG